MDNHVQSSFSPIEDSSIKRDVPIRNKTALKVAFSAIMTSLVAVTTFYLQFPIAATSGYFNVGEVMIYLTAILFGPYIGGIAGGFGAAIADLAGGYASYAPATLVIKFLEGLIIGFLYMKLKRKEQWKFNILAKIIAIIPGGIIMVAGYFLYQMFILQLGFEAAIFEVPLNFLQVSAGLVAATILAIPLEKQTKLDLLLERNQD